MRHFYIFPRIFSPSCMKTHWTVQSNERRNSLQLHIHSTKLRQRKCEKVNRKVCNLCNSQHLWLYNLIFLILWSMLKVTTVVFSPRSAKTVLEVNCTRKRIIVIRVSLFQRCINNNCIQFLWCSIIYSTVVISRSMYSKNLSLIHI